jgi:hypothetical protein
LRDDCEDGKTVFAPTDASKKRKRSDEPKKSRKKSKKSQHSASEDGDDFIDDESDEDEVDDASGSEGSDDEDTASEKGDSLTLDAIDQKLGQLKEDKKRARRERSDIDGKVKDAKKEMAGLEQTKFEIETAMSAICIKSRNDYSKGAIQVRKSGSFLSPMLATFGRFCTSRMSHGSGILDVPLLKPHRRHRG